MEFTNEPQERRKTILLQKQNMRIQKNDFEKEMLVYRTFGRLRKKIFDSINDNKRLNDSDKKYIQKFYEQEWRNYVKSGLDINSISNALYEKEKKKQTFEYVEKNYTDVFKKELNKHFGVEPGQDLIDGLIEERVLYTIGLEYEYAKEKMNSDQ